MSEHHPGAPQPPSGHLRLVPATTPGDEADAALAPGPLTLSEAYRRYAPYVAAVAGRILGRDDELDDLVQDVFLDATRGIAQLREAEAIKGWLARIAVRASIRRLRYRRLRWALSLGREPVDYESMTSEDATPEERATVARVYRALDRLPAQERAAWVLRYVQGETLEQAAEALDCSLSTFQRRLRRATARLDRELPHD